MQSTYQLLNDTVICELWLNDTVIYEPKLNNA